MRGRPVAGSRTASSRPVQRKATSLVQVDLSFERSITCRLARGEIDGVEPHHRERSRRPRQPTGSVLDRRNLRNPGSIWWQEDTFANKGTGQLIAIGSS